MQGRVTAHVSTDQVELFLHRLGSGAKLSDGIGGDTSTERGRRNLCYLAVKNVKPVEFAVKTHGEIEKHRGYQTGGERSSAIEGAQISAGTSAESELALPEIQ